MSNTAIWWIRRDLRLHDNPALEAAGRFEQIIPLFILDETLLDKYSAAENRLAFLFDGLRRLDESLKERGSYLVVQRGDPVKLLPTLVKENNVATVFAQADTHPYATRRDQALGETVRLVLKPGTLIRQAGAVLKNDGDPYVVFTPFKKTWLAQPLPHQRDVLAPPEQINTPAGLDCVSLDDLPSQPEDTLFPAGEASARERFEAFKKNGLADYADKRDFVGQDGTSKLSPYFRFGVLSPREAAAAAIEARAKAKEDAARKGADTWLSELIWRDFYNHVLYHFPHVLTGNFNSDYDELEWLDNEDEFEAWCRGETGYPVVDAAMRQLNTIGWMHNRARMIVASFLVKDLLIDWRKGEAYFMEKLIGGDPAANNGGWQWSAGTGTDAAPYFRIFNPITQSEKYDPDGKYIRQWVPELAALSNKQIHAPWKMSKEEQADAGVIIGRDYPEPLIDHKFARERTLDAYKKAREK